MPIGSNLSLLAQASENGHFDPFHREQGPTKLAVLKVEESPIFGSQQANF